MNAMQKAEYPTVLILSRWDDATGQGIAFKDSVTLHNDADLQIRLGMYRNLEMTGATAYTFTLAELDNAGQVIAQRLAEMEAEKSFGRRPVPTATEMTGREVREEVEDVPTSSTPEAPSQSQETNQPNDTTPTPESQTDDDPHTVTLTVRYQGTPPPPPQTYATGELVAYQDGNGNNPPAHSLAEIRTHLQAGGYRPDYTRWTVPNGKPIRLEVHVLVATGTEPAPTNTSPCELRNLGKAQGCIPEPVSAELKQQWIERTNARTGWVDPTRDPFYRSNGSPGRRLRSGNLGARR